MNKWIAFSLLACSFAFAKGPEPDDVNKPKPPPQEGPWLTGPLIAPSGHTVPLGHVNYEPYVYGSTVSGAYNPKWHYERANHKFTNVLIQPTFQIGVATATEFDIAPQFAWSNSNGQAEWEWNDLPITLAFQILNDKPGAWWPAIKLRFAANVPFGQYQRLSPHKNGTDAGGSGNWAPAAGLVFSRLFHFTGTHFLAVRYWISYTFSTPVHIRDISVYNSTTGSRGTVYPGNVFQTDLGLEYTLSQNWALALDVYYQHNNKRRFSGHSAGAPIKGPSREQISLAPAFEYNWSSNVGIIFGPWFTVAGRNSAQFVQWVGAINVYH
jgi:hypothetical protein